MPGTGIRVQTLAVAIRQRGLTPEQIAAEYGLSAAQVGDARAFAAAHAAEIDLALAAEAALATEASRAWAAAASGVLIPPSRLSLLHRGRRRTGGT